MDATLAEAVPALPATVANRVSTTQPRHEGARNSDAQAGETAGEAGNIRSECSAGGSGQGRPTTVQRGFFPFHAQSLQAGEAR